MSKTLSFSIVVPCYNEELGLRPTVEALHRNLREITEDYEVLIINDKSIDKTFEIAEQLKTEHPKVRVFHNETNRGLGFNFWKGCELATKEYMFLVPGDNELDPNFVKTICEYAGQADIILSYQANSEIRPLVRRMTSRLFTILINWIGGNKIRYYNGAVLQKVSNLRKIGGQTDGFAFQAELIIQQLRMGLTYKEIPYRLHFTKRRTSAFRIKNIVSVTVTVLRLILRYRYSDKTIGIKC